MATQAARRRSGPGRAAGRPSRSTPPPGCPPSGTRLRIAQQQMGVRRTALTLLRVNQKDGFDCPGCAWPEPRAPAHGGVLRERREGGRRGGHPAPGHPGVLRRAPRRRPRRPQRLLAGPAGPAHPAHVPARGRRPLRAGDLGARLRHRRRGARRALGSPDEALFYTSGRTSNEAAFLYQLFARELGTNNLPDCSNMCHESSGSALTETIGIGKGSVLLEDLYQADLIIVAGQNPGTNHPRMLSALEKAKADGAKIITRQPAARGGPGALQEPADPRRACSRAPRSPTSSCRSASAATRPSSASSTS